MKALKAIALLSMSFALATPAAALDLNDTAWIGTFSCKGIAADGTSAGFKISDVSLFIGQIGENAGLAFDFGDGLRFYNGKVINDAKKPATKGALGIVHQGTTDQANAFGEMAWGTVTYEAGKGKLSLKGTRVEDNADGFDSCKYVFKTQ